MNEHSPQRLRELIVLLGHEPLAEIPDVAEAIETEALKILDALVEQLEAANETNTRTVSLRDLYRSQVDEFTARILELEEQIGALTSERDLAMKAHHEALVAHGYEKQQKHRIEHEKARLQEQLEAWDEAFREILDVTERWTRPLTDEERLLRIDALAKAALAHGPNPASMFAPCEKCGRSSEGVRRETVEQGEVVRPGFKCECGWWNWLDSPPSNQDTRPSA